MEYETKEGVLRVFEIEVKNIACGTRHEPKGFSGENRAYYTLD